MTLLGAEDVAGGTSAVEAGGTLNLGPGLETGVFAEGLAVVVFAGLNVELVSGAGALTTSRSSKDTLSRRRMSSTLRSKRAGF